MFVPPESGVPFKVVAAIDINTIANEIYRHNFPKTTLWSKTIEVSLVTGQSASQYNSNGMDTLLGLFFMHELVKLQHFRMFFMNVFAAPLPQCVFLGNNAG